MPFMLYPFLHLKLFVHGRQSLRVFPLEWSPFAYYHGYEEPADIVVQRMLHVGCTFICHIFGLPSICHPVGLSGRLTTGETLIHTKFIWLVMVGGLVLR